MLFEAVLAEQHVARAAARLNLSPSAVSHGLARLRRQFNDPLFLRTPKGVVPTERGLALAQPIAGILQDARKLVASAEPFDPATSTRRFVIGTPNGGSAEIALALLKHLRAAAPGIDLGFVSIPRTHMGWDQAFARLDDRKVDLAILPFRDSLGFAEVPARFVTRFLYEDGLVVGMRQGHDFAADPTLERYCTAQHLLVSVTGEIDGIVDRYLATMGLSRRVAVTVPNSTVAFEMVESTDLLVSAPSRLVATQAKRFGLITAALPMVLPTSQIRVILPKAGMADDGLVWLSDAIADAL
ncbi:MAG: LysR family transcriptional regulator [Paracoccaceae bacterium]